MKRSTPLSSLVWLPLLSLAVAGYACSSSRDSPAPPAADAGPTGADAAGDAATGADAAGDASAGDGGALVAARPYKSKVPAKYDASKPTPLVILLHGYSADGAGQEAYFKLGKVADEKTFLYAYPDGTIDAGGKRFWNASTACCDFLGTKVDDVAYLTAIIDDMSARYNVDKKRIYFVGHSNGGFMAYRMACDLSSRVAAIVSLAGTMDDVNSACKPSSPVSVLHVHGDADGTIAYPGGRVATSVPPYLGARETVAAWAPKANCTGALAPSGADLDLDTGLAGAETKSEGFVCTGAAVQLWTIQGGAHIPALQDTWAGLVWSFLEAHPKP